MLLKLNIKHAGKTHVITIDPAQTTSVALRTAIYEVTGVPTDRMKVMLKGSLLKDDTSIASLGLKADQNITVIGTAGPLPAAPTQPTLFAEDLDHGTAHFEIDNAPGLINLGQTCYLNSTLQALRVIPQLESALENFSPSSASAETRVTTSIKNLFSGMRQTSEAVPPFVLLNNLRVLAPQFAEQDPHGRYAQQGTDAGAIALTKDADEAWTQIISALRHSLDDSHGSRSVIDGVMSIGLHRTLHCVEDPSEPPTTGRETVLKLECNISISTNYLMTGILDNLDQQIEKTSPNLGRMAAYNQKTRLSRLPTNLAIHMVRFYWRRDIQKKAKIMRKVKFPLQLDVSDIVTDELRERMRPVNALVKQMLKDRDDRAREAKKLAGRSDEMASSEPKKLADERAKARDAAQTAGFDQAHENASGIYELSAMVTHKGASADSGHYIGWTRKPSQALVASGDEEWLKFDDDKVSTVKAEKILSLDGGGEDSVAYILLYRAVEV